MMTREDLRKWAENEAEDCLRHLSSLPVSEIQKSIADHLVDAYQRGASDERIRDDKN